MPAKPRAFLSRFIVVLAVFLLVRSGLVPQTGPAGLAAKYPEIEGVYELTLSGAGSIVLQVYFKDGTLRTVEANEWEGRAGPIHQVPGRQ